MRSVCFGIDEDIGTYTILNDTVKLNYLSPRDATGRFKYAVLDSTKKYLRFYNTTPDTTPYWLYIRLNKPSLNNIIIALVYNECLIWFGDYIALAESQTYNR